MGYRDTDREAINSKLQKEIENRTKCGLGC